MLTVDSILASAHIRLTSMSESARLDAELLLAAACQCTRSGLHLKDNLSESELGQFNQLLERRLTGEPVAYLLGNQEFYEDTFIVTPDVLIPRPETEALVQKVLSQRSHNRISILDLGCGSGCIGLSLAKQLPEAQVTLVDLSAKALEVARLNAHNLGITNVLFFEGSWFQALPQNTRFDWIVSNPPYLMEQDPRAQASVLAFEPRLALCSGPDGLDAIQSIIAEAPAHLQLNGHLWLEHGIDQAPRVRQLLLSQGFSEVSSDQDLAQIERITGGVLR